MPPLTDTVSDADASTPNHTTDAIPRTGRLMARLVPDPKTLKRAEWERWEFSIVGPHLIRVTNASYAADDRDAHTYTVGVSDDPPLGPFPAECNCRADRFHDGPCKHRVATVVAGGPLLLDTAVACDTHHSPPGQKDVATCDARGAHDEQTATLADRLGVGGD